MSRSRACTSSGLWFCCTFVEKLAVGVVVPTGLVVLGLVALLLCTGVVSSAAGVVIPAGCGRGCFPFGTASGAAEVLRPGLG